MTRYSFFAILVFLGLICQGFAFTDTTSDGEIVSHHVQENIALLNVDHMDTFPSIKDDDAMMNFEQDSLTENRIMKKKKRLGPRRGGRPGPRRPRPGPRRGGRPGPRRGGPGPRRGSPAFPSIRIDDDMMNFEQDSLTENRILKKKMRAGPRRGGRPGPRRPRPGPRRGGRLGPRRGGPGPRRGGPGPRRGGPGPRRGGFDD